MSNRFEITARDPSGARTGLLKTSRGTIETPVFCPVGTGGVVRSLGPDDLSAAGASMILANTYHLLQRPGPSTVAAMGGIAEFMSWPGPVLTDSGGYQVMSLSRIRSIDDDGVTFNSHIDGREIRLTPEGAIEIQRELGSDIAMVLDECPPGGADEGAVGRALERTIRWAERSRGLSLPPGRMIFGIVQGGFDRGMREVCAKALVGMDFDGYAVGGLSVGEPEETLFETLGFTAPLLPEGKPRYLMGVGKPDQVIRAMGSGIDIFDCVLPTRMARHGTLWTRKGIVRIGREDCERSKEPIDPECSCLACAAHTRAYMRHLLKRKDGLYHRLASLHNLTFMIDSVRAARDAIRKGNFLDFMRSFPRIGF